VLSGSLLAGADQNSNQPCSGAALMSVQAGLGFAKFVSVQRNRLHRRQKFRAMNQLISMPTGQ
jgi:hypothetical protein